MTPLRYLRRVLKVEPDWAEIRRLRCAEGVPIKEIARRLGWPVTRFGLRWLLTGRRSISVVRRVRSWMPTSR